MFLNPGIIHKYNDKYLLGNKEYTSLREFLLALPMCHTVAADLVINSLKIMPAGIVTFSEVNGYIIANVDTQFNFGELKNVSDLKVRLFNVTDSNTIIIQSENEVNEMIDDCDTDADIYFKVGSIVAGNTNICDIPESLFMSLHTNNIPVTNFNSLSDFVTTSDEDNNQEDSASAKVEGRFLDQDDEPVIYISADSKYDGYSVIFSNKSSSENEIVINLNIKDKDGINMSDTDAECTFTDNIIDLSKFETVQMGINGPVDSIISISTTSISFANWNTWITEGGNQIVIQLGQATEASEQ